MRRLVETAVLKIVLDALASYFASSKIGRFVADFPTTERTQFGSQVDSPERELSWLLTHALVEPPGPANCQTSVHATGGRGDTVPAEQRWHVHEANSSVGNVILEGPHMAKYLVEASYLSEGINGLLKEGGTRRREAVDQLFQSLGGKVEAFYFAFGDRDVVIIGELPDNATAAALALRVDASGVTTCKTTVLMTPQEIDAAVTKTVTYRPPGSDKPAEVANWEGEGGHLASGAQGGNE